jgi:hypothetical protein
MKRNVTILDAMSDPKLFGPWFRGKSWDAWRVFLAALFGLPMTPAMLGVYQKHTGRKAAPTVQFREARLLCGRRAGKSLIAALIVVFLAIFRDYAPFLAPGEVATMMVIAADRRQARTIMRYTKGFIKGVPMLASLISRETRETLELSNRVIVEIHTASFKTVRGYSCGLCCNDEECFWPADETSADPASEILGAERPSLITIPFSILLSLSSPHAKRGPMYEAVRDHYGKDDSSLLVWKASSLEMNSSLDPKVIEEAYKRDPIVADAEWGGNFRNDCESFISREAVEACVVKGRLELPHETSIQYTAFVDPSGGSSDAMTLAISHVNRYGRPILDLLREVRPPFSPEKVVREFGDTLRSYGLSEVTGDAYAGLWPRERFGVYGITYRLSGKSRSDIYLDFLPLLNSRRAELLDNARLVSQVAGLERHASRSGSESIDHAPGGHDDLANAAAGALVRCASGGVSSRLAGGGIVSQRGGGQVQIFTGTEPKTRPGPGDPVYWQKRRGGL